MFRPEPNVEVAVAEMFIVSFPVLPRDNKVPGVVVPIPMNPLALIVNADIEEVANVDGDDVAIYSKPPAFLNVHWLDVLVPSVSTSCGRVDEAMARGHCDVVVPMPTLPPESIVT